MRVTIVLVVSIVALLSGASASAPAGISVAAQEECENTNTTVCVALWPAGYGRVVATPRGGTPVTCDYTEVLDTQEPCRVAVPRGSSVTTEAVAETTRTSQFVHWSRPGCQGTGRCTFTPAEDDEWVTAVFTPLELEVGIDGEGTVQAAGLSPPPCEPDWAEQVCTGTFPAEERVTLTATPATPGEAIHWLPGFCEPEGGDLSSNRCTVTMTNIRTFASVSFGDVEPPPLPFQISVKVRVARSGTGRGTVTGAGIECGAKCSEIFAYQSSVSLKAEPEPGSRFVRWVGVCATAATCRFNAGSVTNVEARFERPGTSVCRVPRVVGRRLAAARTRIRKANCAVGRVRSRYARRARGIVIAQTPRAGTRKARGARVHLVVSRGRRR
jgi:hypothetical protein